MVGRNTYHLIIEVNSQVNNYLNLSHITQFMMGMMRIFRFRYLSKITFLVPVFWFFILTFLLIYTVMNPDSMENTDHRLIRFQRAAHQVDKNSVRYAVSPSDMDSEKAILTTENKTRLNRAGVHASHRDKLLDLGLDLTDGPLPMLQGEENDKAWRVLQRDYDSGNHHYDSGVAEDDINKYAVVDKPENAMMNNNRMNIQNAAPVEHVDKIAIDRNDGRVEHNDELGLAVDGGNKYNNGNVDKEHGADNKNEKSNHDFPNENNNNAEIMNNDGNNHSDNEDYEDYDFENVYDAQFGNREMMNAGENEDHHEIEEVIPDNNKVIDGEIHDSSNYDLNNDAYEDGAGEEETNKESDGEEYKLSHLNRLLANIDTNMGIDHHIEQDANKHANSIKFNIVPIAPPNNGNTSVVKLHEAATQIWPHVPLDERPGDMGKSYNPIRNTLSKADQELFDAGLKQHAFNQYVSDQISVHRRLPDVRHAKCKEVNFPEVLPNTSLIIIFHNEAWTTLLRTVHSVLDRSPEKLLHEILLIDDSSDLAHLKQPLDLYMAQYPKVKVIHTKERQGLIRARLTGVSIATGDTITFLDSHCEASEGWLEPLLARIGEDPSHVVMPIIDIIDSMTFAYRSGGSAERPPVGSFSWEMSFIWGKSNDIKREKVTDPVRSPTMAGGLFTINRQYFHQIGLYDTGMEIWGGENIEMSFRIWMCGGTLEIMPCSKVGHIFRSRNPNLDAKNVNVISKNTMRFVEVWLDDPHKKLYYGKTNRKPDPAFYGDISERLELKRRLQCKDFSWYLENIAVNKFGPTKAKKAGKLSSDLEVAGERFCITASVLGLSSTKKILVIKCTTKRVELYYSAKEDIRTLDDVCLDYIGYKDTIQFIPCHEMKGNQQWTIQEDGMIKHVATGKCLTMEQKVKKMAAVVMLPCMGQPGQIWNWS